MVHFCQKLSKSSKNSSKTFKCCQSGEFSQNLVTLKSFFEQNVVFF